MILDDPARLIQKKPGAYPGLHYEYQMVVMYYAFDLMEQPMALVKAGSGCSPVRSARMAFSR